MLWVSSANGSGTARFKSEGRPGLAVACREVIAENVYLESGLSKIHNV